MQVPKSVFHLRKIGDPESRYPLDGVHFERDADGLPYAVASDGRSLIVATWTEDSHPDDFVFSLPDDFVDGEDWPNAGVNTVVPSEVCSELAQQYGYAELCQDVEGDGIAIYAASAETSIRIDTTGVQAIRLFPEWRKVLPDNTDSSAIYVDVVRLRDLLTTMLKAYGKDPDHESAGMTVKISTNDITVAARRNRLKLLGVLRGMKNNESPGEPTDDLRDLDWKPGAPAKTATGNPT